MRDVPRCPWAGEDPLMVAYHDTEWGVPVHEDRRLFEFLVLEGAQAGLSWRTVLRKRDGYRKAFAGFDPAKVARFDTRRVERLLANGEIVRNRLKVEGTVRNAKAFLGVAKEFGSFDAWAWSFVGGSPLRGKRVRPGDVPATSPESDAFAAALKRRGFTFVGSTIVYAFMQAVGMVDDHLTGCFRRSGKAPRGRRIER